MVAPTWPAPTMAIFTGSGLVFIVVPFLSPQAIVRGHRMTEPAGATIDRMEKIPRYKDGRSGVLVSDPSVHL